MPPSFGPHPRGMCDSSPTFQRWDEQVERPISPEGTVDNLHALSAVPSGLNRHRRWLPNVETLGYYRRSLRDMNLSGLVTWTLGHLVAALDFNYKWSS